MEIMSENKFKNCFSKHFLLFSTEWLWHCLLNLALLFGKIIVKMRIIHFQRWRSTWKHYFLIFKYIFPLTEYYNRKHKGFQVLNFHNTFGRVTWWKEHLAQAMWSPLNTHLSLCESLLWTIVFSCTALGCWSVWSLKTSASWYFKIVWFSGKLE